MCFYMSMLALADTGKSKATDTRLKTTSIIYCSKEKFVSRIIF